MCMFSNFVLVLYISMGGFLDSYLKSFKGDWVTQLCTLTVVYVVPKCIGSITTYLPNKIAWLHQLNLLISFFVYILELSFKRKTIKQVPIRLFADIPFQRFKYKKGFLTKAIIALSFAHAQLAPCPMYAHQSRFACHLAYLVDSRCKGVWWWNLHSPACFDLRFGNTAFLLSPLHRDPFLPH